MNPAHLLSDLVGSWVAVRQLWLAGVLAAVLLRGLPPRRLPRRLARNALRLIAAGIAISGIASAAPHLGSALPTDPTPPSALPISGSALDQ
jgi:hypothetical protein